MQSEIPLLVFTDLDGTLLSHRDYRWNAAQPALDRLAHMGAGVVLASSKTAPEITQLRQEMGLQDWPAIVENGAGVLEANAKAAFCGSEYAQLRAKVTKIRATTNARFRGFGDMDVAEVCDLTGLQSKDAQLAKQRAFSEPGILSGTDEEKAEFIQKLKEKGVSAREGGRFLTLSFGKTKADQMAQIISRFAPRQTIALGDAPNDAEMIEHADYGVIIANPHRAPLPLLSGEKSGRIIRTTDVGPQGWNTAILAHLAQLN
ncbi:HAD-IIB family hydrolase [Planktotalea sp.]|uniref:HAD-IIB family hydrolase n=1 Tax=Planktotalea sp. TaxID=2029877 RepID=UPI003D6A2AF6